MRYPNDKVPGSVIDSFVTGNYGEDGYNGDDETSCPICGAFEPEHYYLNDDDECVGCSECLRKEYELFY